MKHTEIPADRQEVDLGTPLSDQTEKRVADLIADAAKDKSSAGEKLRKIADLYQSFMDQAGIEAKGLNPLKPHLDSIAAIGDKRDLSRALGETLRADVDALNNTNFHTANLFGLWVAPGFNDSEHYTAYLMQGGLELPDREYYLSDSEAMRDIRTKYRTHIATMLKLAGFDDTDARGAHHRTGACDRGKTHQPGGKRRHSKGQQHLEGERLRSQSSGPRLGRILSQRRPRRAEEFYRLAARRVHCGVSPCRFDSSPDLEGLAGVPSDRSAGRRLAQSVR